MIDTSNSLEKNASNDMDLISLPPSKTSEFTKELFLGKGSYGSVWLIRRHDNNKQYALKEVDLKNKQDSEKIESFNEIRLLASVKNPNVISYKESFIEDDILYIITEYADGSDLSKIIKMNQEKGTVFKEEFIWSVLIQTSLGLEYLHGRRILHRDLKPSNIFLSGNPAIVKIGDLGVAKLLKQSSTYTQVGTPFYICPEIWRHFPYNMKSDVWSLGCVIYEMCTSKRPFVAHSPKELSRKILRGSYYPIQGFSKDLCDVVGTLLTVNCSERPTIAEVLRMPQVQKYIHLIPPECAPSPSHFSVRHVVRPFPSYKSVIGTIKVPKSLSRVKLPPPTYSAVKDSHESRVDGNGSDNDDDEIKKVLDFDLDSTANNPSELFIKKRLLQHSQPEHHPDAIKFVVDSVIDKNPKVTVPKPKSRLFSFAPIPNLKPINVRPRHTSITKAIQSSLSHPTPSVLLRPPLSAKPSVATPSSSSSVATAGSTSSVLPNAPKVVPKAPKPRRSIFAAPEPDEAKPPEPAVAPKPIHKKRSLIPSAMEPVNLSGMAPLYPPPRKKLVTDIKRSVPTMVHSKPRKSIFAPPSPQNVIRPQMSNPVKVSTPVKTAHYVNVKSPRYLLRSPVERFRVAHESPKVRLFSSRAKSPLSPMRKLRPPFALPTRSSPLQQERQSRPVKERRSIFAPPLNPVAPKYPYKSIRHTKPQISASSEPSSVAAVAPKYVLKKPRQSIFAPPEVPVPPLYPYHKKLTKPPIFFNKKKTADIK